MTLKRLYADAGSSGYLGVHLPLASDLQRRGFFPQIGAAAALAAFGIKNFVATVDFELVNDPQQLAETAFGKTFLGEPLQIFNRQIEQWYAGRGEFSRTEFPERHPDRENVFQVSGEPVAQIFGQRHS